MRYDYKVIHMPTKKFNSTQVKKVLKSMETEGWTLYSKSETHYFFRRDKHCSKGRLR